MVDTKLSDAVRLIDVDRNRAERRAAKQHSLTDAVQLIDVVELAEITRLSKPTIWRHHENGIMPAGIKIGRSVRWILRSGDARTGILDWLEASCPHCGPATETTGGES